MNRDIMILGAIIAGLSIWGFSDSGAGYLIIIAIGGIATFATMAMNEIKARRDAQHWQNYELEERRLQVESLRYDVERKKLESRYRIEKISGGAAVWNTEGDIRFITAHGRTPKAPDSYQDEIEHPQESIAAPQEPAPLQSVIDIIQSAIFTMLYAVQGAGKTTLLQYLIAHTEGEKIIIDPHSQDVNAIGYGRNYPQINAVFDSLIDDLNTRYNTGHFNHSRLNIYLDELTLLADKCPSFKLFMRTMLTECRKINFRLVCCTHSKTAEIIGLKGKYDLADGLTFCQLKHDKRTGRRYALIEQSGEKFEAAIPHIEEKDIQNRSSKQSSSIISKVSGGEQEARRDPQAPIVQAANIPPHGSRADGIDTDALPDRQRLIFEVLQDADNPLTVKDVATNTGLTEANIRPLLSRLKAAGYIVNVARGQYSAVN